MKKLKILKDKDLKRIVSDPVQSVTPTLKELAYDMMYTMKNSNGIGLAGPQVGKYINLLVFDCSDITGRQEDYGVMFNPKVITATGEQVGKEGCLSFPNVVCMVKRYETIKVEYLGLDNKIHYKLLQGLGARVVQHEMAHLIGLTLKDEEYNESK